MIWASSGPAVGPLVALLGRLGGLLVRLDAILGPSWAVLGSSWAALAALVACLGRLERRKLGSFFLLRGTVASGARTACFLRGIVASRERIMCFLTEADSKTKGNDFITPRATWGVGRP